eukprot:gene20458-24984_t
MQRVDDERGLFRMLDEGLVGGAFVGHVFELSIEMRVVLVDEARVTVIRTPMDRANGRAIGIGLGRANDTGDTRFRRHLLSVAIGTQRNRLRVVTPSCAFAMQRVVAQAAHGIFTLLTETTGPLGAAVVAVDHVIEPFLGQGDREGVQMAQDLRFGVRFDVGPRVVVIRLGE